MEIKGNQNLVAGRDLVLEIHIEGEVAQSLSVPPGAAQQLLDLIAMRLAPESSPATVEEMLRANAQLTLAAQVRQRQRRRRNQKKNL